MAEMKIDGIILDVDGTLWDSTPIVAKAWTEAIQSGGGGDLLVTADMLKQLFGKTMTVIMDSLLPHVEEKKRYEILELCCEYEHEALLKNEEDICYEGVKETIRAMAEHVNVFIVSNCQSGYIELFLEKTGLQSCVKDIECFGNTGRPKGENIRMLADRNQLKHPVYVGDTQGDCDASKEAGVPFIHAAYGFGTADEKMAEIEQFSELLKFLL